MLSNGKVECLSKDVASYYLKTTATLRSRAAVVIVNRDFSMVELVATRDVVDVKLDLSGRQVVVASVYLPSEDSVDLHMNLLQELVTKHVGLNVTILGDFNAKSSVWGNPLHKT